MRTQTQHFMLNGSLDLSTSPMKIDPGNALECVNLIPGLEGGYQFIGGYERFDGRAAPSDAQFWELEVSAITGLSVGDTLTGDTSGATAVILSITSDNRVAVTALIGAFQIDEPANGVKITGTEVLYRTETDDEYDQWKHLAANHYRAFIEKVPGSGPIRGVYRHLSETYACRDSADGTSCIIYKAGLTGWQPLPLKSVIKFKDAQTEIEKGHVITDGSSTATVLRVLKYEGNWSGTGVGYLVIDPLTGSGIPDAAALKVGTTAVATAVSAAEQITLKPGGRFEFISHNFKGSDDGFRVYGADGVNPAFEIDQSGLLVPLYSKDANDNPAFIQSHVSRLFLAFKNGQRHHSVVGEPWNFTVSLGAGQVGVGAEITGMLPQSGGVLAIATRRRTFIQAGDNNTNFRMEVAAETAGAFPYTLQTISEAFALDDRGIIQLRRTAAFGGFESGAVTRKVQKLIDKLKPLAIASTVIRRLNQYWLFFSNGTGLACYPINTADGMMFRVTLINYGRPVRCICNAEDETGAERILFGSDDGYVYEAQKGTSFDGGDIEAFVRLPFNHFKSPRVRKRWRKLILELEADGPVKLSITPDIDYGSPDVAAAATDSLSAYGGGGYWDSSNWDEFTWDAEVVSVPEMQLTGSGTNMGLLIHLQSAVTQPFTLHGVLIHFDPRRLER